jgi:curved DNA-binding protein
MEFKDYYKIMGVARDATQDEIKRAYRTLARKYHPDVSKAPDAEARFKELGEAYAVLKDLEKRPPTTNWAATGKPGRISVHRRTGIRLSSFPAMAALVRRARRLQRLF